MDFNSWPYLAFVLAIGVAHYNIKSIGVRNGLLLLASYTFYAFWDWRFLSLILLSTVTDYLCGRAMAKATDPAAKRRYLTLSLVVNLGLLATFKYFNFFIAGFVNLLDSIGLDSRPLYLEIILPVGISFYTFQTMSYTIDLYRGRVPLERNFLNFALFVAFFPQLVAGPIERARNLLPQIAQRTNPAVTQIKEGAALIFWGLFKKVFVADNLAIVADPLFLKSAELSAPETYLAALAFTFQIFADFSAYTDIARGSAKLLGIELMENFRSPFAALNPQDFWRRWHISLSTWLRDYLYIGLGGNRGTVLTTYRNLFLTMLLGGLWHGAAWNYIWWGAYHGVLLCVHRWLTDKAWFRVPKVVAWFSMLHLTVAGFLIFRSTRRGFDQGVQVDQSGSQLIELATSFGRLSPTHDIAYLLGSITFFALPMFLIEWWRSRTNNLAKIATHSRYGVVVVGILVFLVIRWGIQRADAFIYFQF